jgi:hypothetical protein
MLKTKLDVIVHTHQFFLKLGLLFTLLFSCLFLSAQNDVIVEGDLSVLGNGNSTFLKVVGPAGEIVFNPFYRTPTTTLLAYFDGKDLSPQLRFDVDESNFIDFGMDETGAFVVEQSDLHVLRIDKNGRTSIGTNAPQAFGYTLSVGGKIASEEILVDLKADWPDYVFKNDYKLKSLAEVQEHIDKKGHLPGLPAAADVQDVGIELGEMNRVLVEKIEELTLYILQQENRIKALEDKESAKTKSKNEE